MSNDLAFLARKFFKLELPTTSSELKSAFRKESTIHHPDKGGDGAYFGQMVSAYKTLTDKDAAKYVLLTNAEEANPITWEGYKLSELGLGKSGLSADGVMCSTCEGKGFTTVTEPNKLINCHTCRGTGAAVKCSLCQGHGTVRNLRMNNQPTTCPRCRGSRWVSVVSSFFRGPICPTCHGNGGFKSNKPTYTHYRCGDCNGAGERKMFNPLWSKMRISR